MVEDDEMSSFNRQNGPMVREVDRMLRGAIEHVMRYGTGVERVRRLRAASNQWHTAGNDVTHQECVELDRAA